MTDNKPKRKCFNKDYLDFLILRDNAVLLHEDSYKNITRETLISFICNCGTICDEDNKKVLRRIAETSGAYCYSCSVKNKTSKMEDTNLVRHGNKVALLNPKIKEKQMKTLIEKYGVDNPSKNKDIQNKKIETSLENYGVTNPSKSELIKNKKKQTTLKSLGVDNPLKSINVREKSKITSKQKYGTLFPVQSSIIQSKIKKTNIIKYGVECPLNNNDIRDKMYINNIKKYGVSNPAQTKAVQDKMRKSNLEKFGFEYASQNKEIINKVKKTNMKKYGVVCPLNTEIIKENTKIKRIERHINEKRTLNYTHPDLCQYWDNEKNGDLKPNIVIAGSLKKVWFKCKDNLSHSFKTSINSFTQGHGCPFCKNKTETKLYNYLLEKFQNIVTQFKIQKCKYKFCLPFDFCLEALKIIIELDGIQHFKEVSNWGPPNIKRDIYKMRKAEEAGFKVIRIFQEDVYKYDEDWLEKYLLPEIQSNNKNHAFITTKLGLYDEHLRIYAGDEIISISDSESEKSEEDPIIQL